MGARIVTELTIAQAVTAYRKAVESRNWAESHGSHGDGRLSEAQAVERHRLAELNAAIRREARRSYARGLQAGMAKLDTDNSTID